MSGNAAAPSKSPLDGMTPEEQEARADALLESKTIVRMGTLMRVVRTIGRDTGKWLTESLAKRDDRIAALEARLRELEAQPKGLQYLGVWDATRRYAKGDVVTIGGSMWVSKAPNVSTRPPAEGIWQLAVQRGRDGKDAR